MSRKDPKMVRETRTLYRPRRSVVVRSVDYHWHAVIEDMTRYVNDNRGYEYFLLVIDIMSKCV